MLKINVEDGKAEIRVTGTLGDITGEFYHVVRKLKESIAKNNPRSGFVFTAAVISAVLGTEEETAIETIKEAVAERKRSEKADAEDDDETDADEDDDEDEDDDDGFDFDMDAFIKELEKSL